jgi:hypothetical protein
LPLALFTFLLKETHHSELDFWLAKKSLLQDYPKEGSASKAFLILPELEVIQGKW